MAFIMREILDFRFSTVKFPIPYSSVALRIPLPYSVFLFRISCIVFGIPPSRFLASLASRGNLTVTSQASFCLAVTSGFNGFDGTKYLVLTLSYSRHLYH